MQQSLPLNSDPGVCWSSWTCTWTSQRQPSATERGAASPGPLSGQQAGDCSLQEPCPAAPWLVSCPQPLVSGWQCNLPSALHLAPITSKSCFHTAHPSALVPPALMLFPGQQNHALLRLSHWPSLNAFPQSAPVAGPSPPARPLAITPFNKLTALPFLHQRSFLP